MMLLKLCAMPLANDPIICMRRDRSRRVVSRVLSRSRNSRSMAFATASPASRITGKGKTSSDAGPKVSNPMMPRTRPGRISGTQAHAPTPAAASWSFAAPGGIAATSGTMTISGCGRAKPPGQREGRHGASPADTPCRPRTMRESGWGSRPAPHRRVPRRSPGRARPAPGSALPRFPQGGN